MAATTIEWTRQPGTKGETLNPTTGCDKISPGCDNCLAPETRVLRADMTWVPIADIKVGDRLVSFTDEPAIGQNRVWEEATVLAAWETEKPTVDFTLANGATVTASEDHRWLIAKRGRDKWWRKTVDLTFTTQIRTVRCEPTDTGTPHYWAGYVAGATAGDGTFRWPAETAGQQVYWRVAKPARDRAVLDRLVAYLGALGVDVAVRPFDGGTGGFTSNPLPMMKVETRRAVNLQVIADLCEEQPTHEWMAGWLAGMLDTDASYTGGNLRYCQTKPNDVLDRAIRYGKELGFDLQDEDYPDSTGQSVRLTGGIAENIAFLSAISPALERRCRDFYGKRVEAVDVSVVGIRRGPVRRLIDITTSTGTFIAEGALTHNCYALTMARRLKGMGSAKYQNDGHPVTSGPGFGLTVHPDTLTEPLRWRKPRTVFVNSMSDLGHARVPKEFLARVWAVMAATPQHTYQILTKRPERMARIVGDDFGGGQVLLSELTDEATALALYEAEWPLPNVWLGTSIESDEHVKRADHLRNTSAAVRFISAEPLLGPLPSLDLTGIDWLIIGGESGHGARPMELGWVYDLIGKARAAGSAVFVKQLGSVLAGGGKGGNWDLWPADLRIRQYPTSAVAVAS